MIENFIILGTQRTGSTVLFRTLNFHPQIACGGEWVYDQPSHKKVAVARESLKAEFSVLSEQNRRQIDEEYHGDVRWLGFKVLFRSSDKWLLHPRLAPALWIDRLESFCRWLSREPKIHVIHLTRDDQIEWLKSKYLSSKTGLYTNKPYPKGMKVNVPVGRAIKRLQTKSWIDSRIATLSHSNPYLHVSYEDFLHSRERTVDAMMRFLGCDPALANDSNNRGIKRQSKGTAKDYILNYDEIAQAIAHRGLNKGVVYPVR